MTTAPLVHEAVRARSAAQPGLELLARGWTLLQRFLTSRRAAEKRLRVCENVSLGEKRFVAVVQIDQERFLIGGAPNSVSMLARLAESATFASTLSDSASQGPQ